MDPWLGVQVVSDKEFYTESGKDLCFVPAKFLIKLSTLIEWLYVSARCYKVKSWKTMPQLYVLVDTDNFGKIQEGKDEFRKKSDDL